MHTFLSVGMSHINVETEPSTYLGGEVKQQCGKKNNLGGRTGNKIFT